MIVIKIYSKTIQKAWFYSSKMPVLASKKGIIAKQNGIICQSICSLRPKTHSYAHP